MGAVDEDVVDVVFCGCVSALGVDTLGAGAQEQCDVPKTVGS